MLKTPLKLLDVTRFHFGRKDTSDLMIAVMNGKVVFNCHWDRLASASKYFENMLTESRDNLPREVAFPEESSDGWNAVLSMVYPQLPPLTFQQTLLALPLIKQHDMACLIPRLPDVVGNPDETMKTCEAADILCKHELSIAAWFENKAWAYKHAEEFINRCKSPGAVRAAGQFVYGTIIDSVSSYDTSHGPSKLYTRLKSFTGYPPYQAVKSTASTASAFEMTFGNADAANLLLTVPSMHCVTRFNCNWEVISSALPLFAAMKRSNMKETVNNTVTLPGDHLAWKALLQRIHPPYDEFTLDEAVRVVPLLSWIDCEWVTSNVRNVLAAQANSSLRRPFHADVLYNHGMGDIVDVWFKDELWTSKAALRFLGECDSVEALRRTSLTVLGAATDIAKMTEMYHIPALDELKKWLK